jgi:hypothetical protein
MTDLDDRLFKFTDLVFKINFIPYLIIDGNNAFKFEDNQLSYFILFNKLNKIRSLVNNILVDFNIVTYNFNVITKIIETTLTIKPTIWIYDNNIIELDKDKLYSTDEIRNTISFYMNHNFGSANRLISEVGPDGWMEGDITLILGNEYDRNTYEFGIAVRNIEY